MATEEFANNSSTVVTSGGTDTPPQGTAETWIVASSASFPAATTSPPAVQFHVADPASPSEKILVTNISGTTWTVTRGAENTAPVTHSADFTIYQVVTAGFLNSVTNGSSSDNALDWINVVNAYGADPDGVNYSDTAFAKMVTNYQDTGQPGYIPAGSYKIQDPLNWKVAGLVVQTDGSANTTITQYASNTPIMQLAGQGQRVGGLTLTYTSQQTTSQTAANGIEFGDATAGSCWMGIYEDLFVELAYTGLAIPSALSSSSVAGMFSCEFRNIHVLGYAHHGLGLAANGGGSNAGCTGCTWDNIYIHNNYSGSPANCDSYPVYLAVWDEVEFNQLNIEHGESFDFDLASFSQVRNCTIRGLHIESMQLSASSVNGGYINADNGSTVIVDGMTVKFSTMSGSTDNPVARFSTAGPSSVIIRGFSEQSTNTITTPSHPYADFGSIANCEFEVDGITATQVTSNSINPGSGCTIQVGPGLGGNTVTIAEGGTGQTTAGAAFNALNPNAAPVAYQPSNPSSTVSLSLVMAGLGATCVYTPAGSGKVLVNLVAQFYNNTAAVGVTLGARYGTLASSVTTTVASGSNGGEISAIASWGGTYGGNGTLDVASTSGWATSGTLWVAASGSTFGQVTYTGISGSTFTGCAYVAGSATGTIATGNAVTSYPPNGGVAAGTRFGGNADGAFAANQTSPRQFACTDLLSLTAAKTYWFDLAFLTANSSDAAQLANISMTLVELPLG